MVGHHAASGQVSVNSAFTWSLLLCDGYQFCSSNTWLLQHHSVHALDMNAIIVFVYLMLQFKWNQLSSNNSRHISCIHKGLHAGKWPDPMTSKPYYVSTLGYHWTDYTGTTMADATSGLPVAIRRSSIALKHTGRPLEPQVRLDATGTTLADVSTQCYPSSNPVLICIIGTHWKTTGRPLEAHWKHIGYQ